MKRFKKASPCPICGGYDEAARGKGERCWGFLSEDGEYAHCTREDVAGEAPFNQESQTYSHRLEGDCACGKQHGPPSGEREQPSQVWDYRDEDGKLLFQVCRFSGKKFSQRNAEGEWNLKGVRRILYRLPEIIARPEETVFVVEGEKDVDRLLSLGLLATTNAGGAGKWRDEYSEALAGRQVIILPDNDEPGRKHGESVRVALSGKAKEVWILDLPGVPDKGDVTDWLDGGHTQQDLEELVASARRNLPVLLAKQCFNQEAFDALVGRAQDLGDGELAAQIRALSDRATLDSLSRFAGSLASAAKRPGATLELLAKQTQGYLDDIRNGSGDPFRQASILTHAGIIAEPVPQLDWIVPPLFASKTLCILSGREGVGKSFLALYVAQCIASGKPLWGALDKQHNFLFPVEERPRILIVDLQNSRDMLLRRYQAVAQGLWPQGGIPDLAIDVRCELRLRLEDASHLHALSGLIKDGGYGFVILDSLRYAHGRDENDSTAMESVLTPLRLLAYETGSCILPIHHEGKGRLEKGGQRPQKDRPRGSTEIMAACHTAISVSEEAGQGLCISHIKSNLARKAPMILIDMEGDDMKDEPITFNFVGDASSKLGAYEVALRQIEAILAEDGGKLRYKTLEGRAWAEHQIQRSTLGQALKRGMGLGRLVKVEHSPKNVEYSLPAFEDREESEG
ncbi:MAG TPA: AAA family ATPase [Phycisphaerae bacterium]|nr:AAA family ATPase [Phycisphaerae bacterium]